MLVVLSGRNDYMRSRKLRELLSGAQKEVGELGIEKIDAQEVGADIILQAVQSLPFLVPSKFVLVRNVQLNSSLIDRIDELIDRIADGVTVVLEGPVFDKRKSAWGALKKRADEVHEYGELKSHEVPAWLLDQAQEIGATISRVDAQYLVDRVGSNQLALASELQKMSLAHTTVTRDVINRHTVPSPQSTVFDMLDAAFSGNKDRAVELYRQQRQQRVEPHYVIAMLTWQLHALALAVFAKPATEQTLTGAGQSPYAARKALNLARGVSHSQIQRYVTDLAELEITIKTSAEPDAALELYFLNL